jgi:hypothetical protein
MDMDTTVFLPVIKSNGATVLLRNQLLFAVNSNDFTTFKKAVTSDCNGASTVKNGSRIKCAELLLPVTEVK